MKSLLDLVKALYGPKALSSTLGTRTNVVRLPTGKLQRYLKEGLNINNTSLYLKALPFTLGAFLLFFILYIFIEKRLLTEFQNQIITVFFIFTSCISFPHILTMNVFYKNTFKSN